MKIITIPLIDRETNIVIQTTVGYFLKHFFENSYAFHSVTFQTEGDFENLNALFKELKYKHSMFDAWKAGIYFITENYYHLPINAIKEIIKNLCMSEL